MDGVWFFRYTEKRVGKTTSSRRDLSWEEAERFADLGAEPLLWKLAMDKRLPFHGINDVLNTPANILFQAACWSEYFERVEKGDKIEAAINKALGEVKNGR